MEMIEIDGLSIDQNTFSFSTLSHAIDIEVEGRKRKIHSTVSVQDNHLKKESFSFDSLEDALEFAQKRIPRNTTNEEIVNQYIKWLEERKPVTIEPEEMILSKQEICEEIANFFGQYRKDKIEAIAKVSLEMGEAVVRFYMVEHLRYDGIHKDIKSMLTNSDIERVLKFYAETEDCDLLDYEYIKGVKETLKRKRPYFEGMKLLVKSNNKVFEKQRESE
ncbi:MAG: hypothetical protein J6X28_01780 [Bacilli bacterium]|nr:hypothetical protein [Bacilli bacterium]